MMEEADGPCWCQDAIGITFLGCADAHQQELGAQKTPR